MTNIYLNITTEDGELLGRVEVELAEDPQRPLGNDRVWITDEIEDAARIVLARKETK